MISLGLILAASVAAQMTAADLIFPWGARFPEVQRQYESAGTGIDSHDVLLLRPLRLGAMDAYRELYFVGGRLAFATIRLRCTQWPQKSSDTDCSVALKQFAAKFGPKFAPDGGCVEKFEVGSAEFSKGDAATGFINVVPLWKPALPVYERLVSSGCF